MRPLLLALLVCAAAAPLSARTATLLKDINPDGPEDVGVPTSLPRYLTAVGGKVFFAAFEPSSGLEVWVSDGTAAGTELLQDESPGAGGDEIQVLGSVHGLFLWSTRRGSEGVSLRRSDGTRAGTFEFFPGTTGLKAYGPEQGAVTVAGSRLYFLGCDPAAACRLWMSDGTVAGTVAVPGSPSFLQASQNRLTPVGSRVFFVSDDSLWVSDGTAAGTHALKAASAGRRLTAAGNRLYFTALIGGIEQLWTSDGTPAGTIPVSRFTKIAPFSDSVFLLPSGTSVFFSARDGKGEALWQSDGSPAGTKRLTDTTTVLPVNGLPPTALATANGHPLFLLASGLFRSHLWTSVGGKAVPLTAAPVSGNLFQGAGRVYFVADDGVHGFEPWVSDGTVAGTHPLEKVCRGICDTSFSGFQVGANAVYFASGADIFRTDGTEAGTYRITTPPFAPSVYGFEVAEVGRTLFVRSSTAYGESFWVRDENGQDRVVTDIARGAASSLPDDLAPLADRLFFTACDGHQRSVWQAATANPADTAAALVAPAGSCLDQPTPIALTPAAGVVFFLRMDDGRKLQLWRTDGTEAGTFPLTQGGQGVAGGNPSNPGRQVMTPFQGKLLFGRFVTAAGGDVREEIWESDGTLGGTRKSPYLPDTFTDVLFMTALHGQNDEIYFFAAENHGPTAVWRSDGTVTGTHKLATVGFDNQGAEFVRLGSFVFFIAYSPASNRSAWRTDGTADGTSLYFNPNGTADSYAMDLTVFQNALYFFTDGTGAARTLWRSDGTLNGTAIGTVAVRSFDYPNPGWQVPPALTAAAGKLFFAMSDTHGSELWATDGTPAGTALVKDIHPGPDSSLPTGLTVAGNRLYFSAHDGEHGFELWQSDGTAAGTHLVQDLAPEALSSNPDHLTVAGGNLFFSADDGQSGRELWSLPLAETGGCQPSSAHLCLNGGRYQVEAAWRDSQGNRGFGTAVPLSGDTGYFWFFAAGNVEAVVKVLDGTGVNGHVWVFYGALSNVEYSLTVTDTQTGLSRRYFNPQGQLASVGDVYGFGPLGAYGAHPTIAPPSPLPLIAERRNKAAAVPCVASPEQLCLNEGRFAVTVAWKDFQGNTGKGTAVPLAGGSGTTGTFWFFNAANTELVVKALDGRAVNGHFWIFFGALSNVEYTVTVTDSNTGVMRTYTNPSGRFASVADTLAF